MAIKNAILKMKVEGILNEIWLKSGASQIIVDQTTGETLATRLASLATDIESAVAGGITPTQVDEKISAAISALIDDAPETMNTLKEVSDYIDDHQEVVDALNQAIGTKVDKVEGKGLSANDFTDALLAKLNSVTEGATKVEASNTNGNIKVNGSEVKVYEHAKYTAQAEGLYKVTVDAEGHVSKATAVTKDDIVGLGIPGAATVVSKSDVNGSVKVDGADVQVYSHPTGAGAEHLPSGGEVGQVLRATGNGQGAWGEAIRSGVSEPTDLAEGEVFIQFIE